MNNQKIDTAVAEAKRPPKRVEELREEQKQAAQDGYARYGLTHGKHRGAVRRASMDLTRALADLRRRG